MSGQEIAGRGGPKVRWGRMLLPGVAGAAAWMAAMMALFGPAQTTLANPAYQSQKFLDVFSNPAWPPARMAENPAIMPVGLLDIALLYAGAFAAVRAGLPGNGRLAKGFSFGIVAPGFWRPRRSSFICPGMA